MSGRVSVWLKGLRVDDVTVGEILEELSVLVKRRMPTHIVTLNAEMFWMAQRRRVWKDLVNSAELVTADGAGVVWAARVLGYRLRERVTGYGLFRWCLKWADENRGSVFFVGGRARVLDRLVAQVRRSYRHLRVVGAHHGYFGPEREAEIVESVRKTRPDFLFVGLGAFRQEVFIHDWREEMRVPVMVGVGGAFDAFTGAVPRPPGWVAEAGLEWLFRTVVEPRRLLRVWRLPLFALEVLWHRLAGGRAVAVQTVR